MEQWTLPAELLLRGQIVRWTDRPLLMGIVNVTPDSFSDGGKFFSAQAAVDHAGRLIDEGADWIDVGGESTRPGAEPVDADEELRRVLPVIEALSATTATPIAIDTYKPAVARTAVAAGASIINDVTGFREREMIEVAAGCDAACLCMHMRGTPRTMQDLADYDDIIGELHRYFEDRLNALSAAGVDRRRVVVDPGIGFAKKRMHNLEILRRIDELHRTGRPVLLGASRKRIVGELTGQTEDGRLAGTIATSIMAALAGVQILRVHDVRATKDALAVVAAIQNKA